MNIVLVHGILGFSHLDVPLLPVDYFAGVANFLRSRFQAAVIAPTLDPTAGIDIRSAMLHESIAAALGNGSLHPGEPIDILAHSMGGLDSRRMIAKSPVVTVNGNNVPIRTLATIGTPHRGSPVADLVAQNLADVIPGLGDILGKFRISLNGLHDLTTQSTALFNAANPDQPSVKYLSVAGGGRHGLFPTSRFFLPLYEFMKLQSKGLEANDGVVGVSSAKWGLFDDNLWPADHADEIGHDLDCPLGSPEPAALQRYEQLVARIAQ